MTLQRETVEVYGVGLMFAFTLALAVIWFAAFLSGGRVAVTIDAYGEQWLEFALWVVATPVFCFATYSVVTRR